MYASYLHINIHNHTPTQAHTHTHLRIAKMPQSQSPTCDDGIDVLQCVAVCCSVTNTNLRSWHWVYICIHMNTCVDVCKYM